MSRSQTYHDAPLSDAAKLSCLVSEPVVEGKEAKTEYRTFTEEISNVRIQSAKIEV